MPFLIHIGMDERCQYDCPTPENDSADYIFWPLMIVLFFVCGVRSNRQSRGEQLLTSEEEQHSRSSGRGLTQQQIDELPQRILVDTDMNSDNDGRDDVICSICLLQFTTGDEVGDLQCKHFFHTACVDSWLVGEPSCPLCRTECRPEPPSSSSRGNTSVLARGVRVLRGETTEQERNEESGLEMNYVSSLELTEEETQNGNATIPGVPSGEQSSELPNERRP